MRTNRRDRRRQEEEERETEYRRVLELKRNPIEGTILPERSLVPIQEVSKAAYSPRIVLPKSNLSLIILAYSLGAIGLGINAWFAYDRGTTAIDKSLMASLGLVTEAMAFYLPNQASRLWMERRLVAFVFALVVSACLFASALINGLGFASLNLADTATVRAERITPAVSDAQRRLDTLSASRKDECQKRGDRCRQLEKDEQTAIQTLRVERDRVSETADPQIASAAKLIAWVTLDRFHPSADDFAMLRLLLLTLLPQLGGLVLMVAKRA